MSYKDKSGGCGREKLNKEATDTTERRAAEARRVLMDYANKAVHLFWEQDEAALADMEIRDVPAEESIGIYVLEDVIHAPIMEGKSTAAKTLLVVPNIENTENNEEYMRIYVALEDSGELPSEERLPTAVYFERADRQGSVRRYAVSEEVIYEYVSAADTGKQEIMDEFHPDRLQKRLALWLDTGLPIVDKLTEDLINMRAIAQRVIAGDGTPPLDY